MSRLPQPDPRFIKKISPVFSILEHYFRYEVKGLSHIPHRRALVVINHGIIPFHGFLLAKKFLDQRGILARGLGASFLFHLPGLRELFQKGGAVNASPKNAERLLKEGNVVMLAPGGIYEALIAKSGLHRIPWERRLGFVRLAVKTNTPIVPTYCRGINSAYHNFYFLLKPRIKFLEMTRFSLPFFVGLGLLPFPVKLVHRIGRSIPITRKKGESLERQVQRIHREVIQAMVRLAKMKD